ncbi:MAG: anthranilate synthase component I family protein [Verrucomicrobiales bacterium]|nr:anthranilate synthase component I family protein [Verrucomicrobiales bacterium]MCP5525663.1 anthranilate synthase component I family protein [Verrucomicrobiales bacterium]
MIEPVATAHTPASLAAACRREPGVVLLESTGGDVHQSRHSFVAARPFAVLRAWGAACELAQEGRRQWLYGDPWMVLERLLARYDLGNADRAPFPLGGCFGVWGYDLKHFIEPRLPRTSAADLGLPDLHVGFHDSLVVFDHRDRRTWVVSTGLLPDGSRQRSRARQRLEEWRRRLDEPPVPNAETTVPMPEHRPACRSSLSREEYLRRVERVLAYIAAGDIYQVNLSQRFTVDGGVDGWVLHEALRALSPAPFAGWLDAGDFALVSSSPELFLRLSGDRITTCPIKGTRPRAPDPVRDAALAAELTGSPKEQAELVMITDLLRNDLGRVCEFGSIRVPRLAGLESFAQVHHLVSTVTGRLRDDVTHLSALAGCFPGGSITGAPKVRAMEIIEELEPVTRGPFTGCLGYLGFNRESQLSILIRMAVCLPDRTCFHAGAGIVAESDPSAEYAETLTKSLGIRRALAAIATGEPPLHRQIEPQQT